MTCEPEWSILKGTQTLIWESDSRICWCLFGGARKKKNPPPPAPMSFPPNAPFWMAVWYKSSIQSAETPSASRRLHCQLWSKSRPISSKPTWSWKACNASRASEKIVCNSSFVLPCFIFSNWFSSLWNYTAWYYIAISFKNFSSWGKTLFDKH